jgi:hypothetical protein
LTDNTPKRININEVQLSSKQKEEWGEIIRKIVVFFVLAIAMAASAPAIAQSAAVGTGGVDILGLGIFETGDSAFKFPAAADTNFDSVEVGNDNAVAFGIGLGAFPFNDNIGATARNNLEIKKNQNSGECVPCQAIDSSGNCEDSCLKYNIEQIKVGSRNAMAIGIGVGVGPFASNNGAVAENNIKIVTNQE